MPWYNSHAQESRFWLPIRPKRIRPTFFDSHCNTYPDGHFGAEVRTVVSSYSSDGPARSSVLEQPANRKKADSKIKILVWVIMCSMDILYSG